MCCVKPKVTIASFGDRFRRMMSWSENVRRNKLEKVTILRSLVNLWVEMIRKKLLTPVTSPE